MTTLRPTLLLAALLAASCTTNNENGILVITKVVAPTVTLGGGSTTCTYSPTSDETIFATFNASVPPTSTHGLRLAAVVQNRLAPNGSNIGGRLNNFDFLALQAVVTYEGVGAAAVSIPQQLIPLTGTVPANGTAAIGIDFFPPGTTGIPGPGSTIRLVFHIEGKLLDGSTLKSSEYNYIVTTCGTGNCDITAACQ